MARRGRGSVAVVLLATLGAISVALDWPPVGPVPTPEAHRGPTRCSSPRTLDEAHQVLAQLLSPELVQDLRARSDRGAAGVNSALGRELRNIWGLWNRSPLRDHLLGLGLRHPDEMSELILVTFVRYLSGRPLRVAEEVARLRTGALRPIPRCPPCIHSGSCTTARVLDERLGRDRGFLVMDCCCGFRPHVVEGVLQTIGSTREVVILPSMVPFLYHESCRDLPDAAL